MFPMLDKVETPDEKTVVFKLKTPDATFPQQDRLRRRLDRRPQRSTTADGLRKDGKAVGSGPYKLDSFDDDQAVFSVNENYKGTAEAQNSGVTLKFFHGDQSALKTALPTRTSTSPTAA